MSVDDSPLDIVEISEVLESPLQQPCLLAQLTDRCLVVVREHLVAENRICYLQIKFR